MKRKFLDCPFCKTKKQPNLCAQFCKTEIQGYSVMCQNCASSTGLHDTEKLAIRAWNTRYGTVVIK